MNAYPTTPRAHHAKMVTHTNGTHVNRIIHLVILTSIWIRQDVTETIQLNDY